MTALFWNRDERRLRAVWRLLIQAAMFGVAMLLATFTTLAVGVDDATAGWWPGVIPPALLAVTVWLAGRLLDRRSFADFGMRIDRAWLLDCAAGMAIGAVLMCSIVAGGTAAGWMHVQAAEASAREIAVALPAALGGFVLIAVGEELFSRGYHMRNIAEGLNGRLIGPRWAVAISVGLSATIFCALHVPGTAPPAVGLASLFLAGVLLAVGFVATGRLGLPIGLHLTWNLCQGFVFGLPVSGNTLGAGLWTTTVNGPALWTGGDFGPEGGLLGVFAVVVGIALTLAWARVRYKTLRIDGSLADYRGAHAVRQSHETT